MSNISSDKRRFEKIVKGKIRKNMKKYISKGEMIGKQGGKKVSIPVPRLDLPKFKLDPMKNKGVGHGDGEVGDSLGGDPRKGKQPGSGEAGREPGQHDLEVEVELDELLEIMGEELGLPHIEPKGESQLDSEVKNYNSIAPEGPESLRHNRRTYKKALKRMISSGEYDPENPVIVPRKEDKIYRYPQIQTKPRSQAAIIYIMDVSGSMGDMQKEIVRTASFWIDGWLNKNYSNLETKYIIHSTTAEEVTKHRFYHTHESGGTQISSSYELASKILKSNYPFSDWNVYVFQFSDGDNWSHDDSNSINILKTDFLGKISQFAYGQVESPFGSGRYLNLFNEHFEKEERFVSSTMETKEDVYSTLKDFLGKGH